MGDEHRKVINYLQSLNFAIDLSTKKTRETCHVKSPVGESLCAHTFHLLCQLLLHCMG